MNKVPLESRETRQQGNKHL